MHRVRVALAGPMGAGKTTVGRLLARRWGVPFVDIDQQIGDVSAVFASEGEAGFRGREREALAQAVRGEGVLALGGGTVVDPRNRERLNGWRVFVLLADAATLRARVGEGAGRPLAGDLERLLLERAHVWAHAGEIVDTTGQEAERVADDLEARCGFR